MDCRDPGLVTLQGGLSEIASPSFGLHSYVTGIVNIYISGDVTKITKGSDFST